jgi:hypothetical protein
MYDLTTEELTVFTIIVSEPREWGIESMSLDMGSSVSAAIAKLRGLGLISKFNKLYATEDGIRFAMSIGLKIGGRRPRLVTRERIKELYLGGMTSRARLAHEVGVERAVAWYHVKALKDAGEI